MPLNTAPRIGLGWDRHGLVSGRPCILGGIEIPFELGPIGHSDADVLLHALTDSLLGAAGLDDLGTLFSDQDPRWKDANSKDFLTAAMTKLSEKKLQVVSVDLVVICDQPKIRPYREAIRQNLSKLLDLDQDRINLKGKTTEGGCSGSIAVQAVALLLPL